MKNLITCLVVCVLSGATFADTWTVDDDGKADFDNIQAAIDASSDGDEILVAPGTYTSTADEVVDMLGKEVWLHSSEGQEVTIIDGEGARRGIWCVNDETSNTIIEGFTITNGYSMNSGGGMYNTGCSPTLNGCTFENNTSAYGGGMANAYDSSPTLENCTFIGNTATGEGGGFRGGGGMHNYSSNPFMINCTFIGNTANFGGGAIYNNEYCSPALTNCTLCSNTPTQIYGAWSDEGGNIVTAICPFFGACCTNDICLDSEEEGDCNHFGGQWLGEGTACAGNGCPISCAEDVNGDGVVDVSDLLAIIAVWGACP